MSKPSIFDNIFVLNLDHRVDRFNLVSSQLNRFNLKFERVSGVDGKSLTNINPKIGNGWNHVGVAGCLLSHKKILKIAMERNLSSYMVVEDDTILSDEFEKIYDYYSQLPEDWDVFYLSGLHLGPLKSVNVNISKCSHTLVTNMFAMNSKFFKVMNRLWPDKVEDMIQPADLVLASLQSTYNFYTVKPFMAWQGVIFSDIENKTQDHPHLRPEFSKMSLIVSSFNQKERLRFCLQSAVKQTYYNYEVIVADDNSTDGTVEMVREEFPGVKIISNKNSIAGIYTLADNWNTAVQYATGTRLIFTNADCVLPRDFISAHSDKIMKDDIIFGPNERTDESIEPLLKNSKTVKELLEKYTSSSSFGKDLRHDTSAYTYNQQYSYYYPWGNNFSVPLKAFKEVHGFPKLKEYGGEEMLLCKKLTLKKGLKIKSNCNTKNIHLWHPIINTHVKPFNETEHESYING